MLRGPMSLLIAQLPVDHQVFAHRLMGIKPNRLAALATGVILGKRYQLLTNALTLATRRYCHIPQQQLMRVLAQPSTPMIPESSVRTNTMSCTMTRV